MDSTVATTEAPGRIVLAREKPFRFGPVEVRPASREIVAPGGRQRLQPRVMQVLVALARARGEILTRDDLTESCWDGRIVGEDALSRVMSKLRSAGLSLGPDGWRLETIPRVGYRLTAAGWDPDSAPTAPTLEAPPPTPISRRVWIGAGVGGLSLAAAGTALWLRRPRVPDQARALYERAANALGSGLPEDNQQAQGYLREAVARAPDYAQAWGALAFAYQAALLFTDPARQPGVKAQSEAAARRALELDPREPQATATLALLAPVWRNWTNAEELYRRALALHAHDPLVEQVYARLLLGVGRLKDAVAHGQAAVKGDEFAVWHHHTLGLALWSVGRVEEADQLVAKALARWPRHYALWFLQLQIFAYSGRADRAVALGDDLENRPLNIPFADVELSLKAARALATRTASDIQAAVEANLAAAQRGVGYAENAMALVSALGHVDEAFALAGALYQAPQLVASGQRFSTGRFQVASRRQTHHLFMPPTAAMRADPRFMPLIRQIGVADYWRAWGHPPPASEWLGVPRQTS